MSFHLIMYENRIMFALILTDAVKQFPRSL